MTTVGQVLRSKGHEVWTIGPDAKVIDALRQMAHKNIGAILVLDKDRIVGIFSERDYARSAVLKGRSAQDLQIKELMSPNVFSITPDKNIEVCMELMTSQRVRHLPVLEENKVVGIISIGDVVKSIISKQQHTIEELQNYITSSVT